MLVACGIAERDGKVLICKRPGDVPYAGCWEFPCEVLSDVDTLEETLQTAFFERISAVPGKMDAMFAFDSRSVPDARIFTFKVNFFETNVALEGYADARWIGRGKLKSFHLVPDCVTIVKEIQKNT